VRLSVAVANRPHVRALLAGETGPAGYELAPVRVDPIISAYRQMVRDLAFDVCELAPVTCLMALRAGVPIRPIPVFLDRRFHHGDLRCAAASGIATPADLEGQRVGVRAYSVSTGVWGRGMLAEDFAVDLDRVTWVVDDDDHLPVPPMSNVERVNDGRSLGELLRAGRIDAAFGGNAGTGRAGAPRPGWAQTHTEPPAGIGAAGSGSPYPLFEHPDALARGSYRRTGIYPLHAVVVVRADLVARDPGLPSALYAAFAESKRRHLARDPSWETVPHLRRQRELVDGDPLPYGPLPNAPTLDALVRFSRSQGLVAGDPGELFPAGDYPAA